MRRPGRKSPLNDLEIGDPSHSYAYAIALLALRDFTASEMRKKLAERGYLEIAIEPVIFDLECESKINDRRYGFNLVASKAGRGRGPVRIRHELRRKGVNDATIEEAVKTGEDAPDFQALARAARARKFGPGIPKDRKERARQARFLQYRGFSNDHIRAALEGSVDDASPDPDCEPDR